MPGHRRGHRAIGRSVEVIPEFLYDAPEEVLDLVTRMWPLEWDAYPSEVHAALVETLNIASLGTLLALVVALPVGVLATHNLVPFAPLNLFAIFVIVIVAELAVTEVRKRVI